MLKLEIDVAKPTHHSALESMGFKLAGEFFNGSSDRIGVATTKHYVLHTNSPGGKISRPVTHHVHVDEFGRMPGKYNLSYHVTQDGQPYSEGDYDTIRRHKDNFPRGSADPIADIMTHHRGVLGALSRGKANPLTKVNPNNVHGLTVDQSHHWSPAWGADDPDMKSRSLMVRGPDFSRAQMTYLNAATNGPVSNEDWNSFVAGRNPVHGMMPDGTPVVDHFDPDYGRLEEPDSRGARQRTYLNHAVQRGPSGEPEVYEFRGRCVTCGTPTWNTQDGGEAPEWEHTGNAHYAEEYGMHGPDVPQCADCANDYERYNNAIRIGQKPGGRWHHPGARVNSCDRCADDLMNEADEELH